MFFAAIFSSFDEYQRISRSKQSTTIIGPSSHTFITRRSLWNILCVGLACFGIHPEKEAKGGALYFFKLEMLENDARASSSTTLPLHSNFVLAPSNHGKTPDCIPTFTSDFERSELLRIAAIYSSSNSQYLAGNVSCRQMVLAISPVYWLYISWTLASGRQRMSWTRCCRSCGLKDVGCVWPCGNLEESMPEGDILSNLQPSYINHVRRVLMTVEHRVRSLTGIPGPIIVGSGALVHLRGTRSLQRVMSNLGFFLSYAEVLRIRNLWKAQRDSSPRGAFASFPPHSFVNVSLDNLDVSLPNQMNEIGKDTSGFHFTFASAHGRVLPRSLDFSVPRPEIKYNKCNEVFESREALVDHFSTDVNSPNFVSYSALVLGAIWRNRRRLSSSESRSQLSLRHMLMSILEVFPASGSTVVFARLENFKASDANELIRLADDCVEQMIPGAEGNYQLLGVSGDFPVNWILWKEFTRRVAEGQTPKWFPMPGGAAFHDLKVGILPTLKHLMEGGLVEDLIADGRAGLSKWYTDNWPLVGNLRKNRRVNDDVLVASVISTVQTLLSEDPELETALNNYDIDSSESLQSRLDRFGSSLRVSEGVSAQIFEDGVAIRNSMLKFGRQFRNADLYLRVFLLELLIPATGLQVLSSVGQTEIYQQIYFSLVPILMQTTKSSYQKASVQFMHMMTVLPPHIVADIFGGLPGDMVVNRGRNPVANLPHDETLEIGVGGTKKLPIKKVEPLLESVNWIGEMSRAASGFVSALRLSPAEETRVVSLSKRDEDGMLTFYDRERGIAANVGSYLNVLEEKKQFGAVNLKKQFVCNLLGTAPVELRDVTKIVDLLTMRDTGLKKLAVLVSRICPGFIKHVWRECDVLTLRLPKPPARPGAWTRKVAIASIAKVGKVVVEGLLEKSKSAKSPVDLDGQKIYSLFTKKWKARVDALLRIITHSESQESSLVVAEANRQLTMLYSISHICSPLSLAYRDSTLSFKPGHGIECRQRKVSKSGFFRTLQELCASAELLGLGQTSAPFFFGAITHVSLYDSIHLDVENVAHFGLQKSARSRKVAEVMLEQMEGQLRSVMTGARSNDLRHVYLHCDVAKWTVLQKGGTQASRDEMSGLSTKESVTRQFDEDVECISISRADKEDFTSGYLFLGSIAALRMNNAYEKSSGKRRNVRVFLLGGSFAVQSAALGVDFALLDIMRCPPGCDARVLVFRKDMPRPDIVSCQFSKDVQCYDRSSCFMMSQGGGMVRYPAGDSQHGEAETRILCSHYNVTKPELRRAGFAPDTKCLVLSMDIDCPNISLACSENTAGENVVHKVGSQFIYIDRAIAAVHKLGLTTDAIVAAGAISGNDFCPGTDGVNQKNYLSALLTHRLEMRGWHHLGNSSQVCEKQTPADFEAVILTAFAFVDKYFGKKEDVNFTPSFLVGYDSSNSKSVWVDLEAWLVKIRKSITSRDNITSASRCLPETQSIVLQGRRAAFVLHYWKGSYKKMWDRDVVDCTGEEWGYCTDSMGQCWPLYEDEEQQKVLKTLLARPFASCGCKECKNMTCSCRRAGKVCLPGICRKCAVSCLNKVIVPDTQAARSTAAETNSTWSTSGVVVTENGDDAELESPGAIFLDESSSSSEESNIQAEQFNLLYGEDSESENDFEAEVKE